MKVDKSRHAAIFVYFNRICCAEFYMELISPALCLTRQVGRPVQGGGSVECGTSTASRRARRCVTVKIPEGSGHEATRLKCFQSPLQSYV